MKIKRAAKIFFEGVIETYIEIKYLIALFIFGMSLAPIVILLCKLGDRLFGTSGAIVAAVISAVLIIGIVGGITNLILTFKNIEDEEEI